MFPHLVNVAERGNVQATLRTPTVTVLNHQYDVTLVQVPAVKPVLVISGGPAFAESFHPGCHPTHAYCPKVNSFLVRAIECVVHICQRFDSILACASELAAEIVHADMCITTGRSGTERVSGAACVCYGVVEPVNCVEVFSTGTFRDIYAPGDAQTKKYGRDRSGCESTHFCCCVCEKSEFVMFR